MGVFEARGIRLPRVEVKVGYDLSDLDTRNQTLVFCKSSTGKGKKQHSNHQSIILFYIIIKGVTSSPIFYLLMNHEAILIKVFFLSSVSYGKITFGSMKT